jgi:hypothetical protein
MSHIDQAVRIQSNVDVGEFGTDAPDQGGETLHVVISAPYRQSCPRDVTEIVLRVDYEQMDLFHFFLHHLGLAVQRNAKRIVKNKKLCFFEQSFGRGIFFSISRRDSENREKNPRGNPSQCLCRVLFLMDQRIWTVSKSGFLNL